MSMSMSMKSSARVNEKETTHQDAAGVLMSLREEAEI